MKKDSRGSWWIFVRVDAARNVGQRHVVGVMRRDTFAGGGPVEGPRGVGEGGWRGRLLEKLYRPMAGVGRRERVELEARSVIRQVGIHIYRVVKSIGVSVSRVSCKETMVGDEMRVDRGRGWEGGTSQGNGGSSPRHQTDEDRT